MLGVAVAVAACGGKGKTGTTPTGTGSGSDQSMKDPGDPTGTGGGTGSGAVPNPNGGGGSGAGPIGSPTDGPPVIPPNLDADPAQAKAGVDAQLSIARAALAAPTPDPDGALRAARQALQIDAASVEAAAYIAFAYYHKRLYDTAELVLDDLFKRAAAKQNAMVFYVYGLVYDKTNRPERAQKAFEESVRLDPKHASALVNLGVYQLKNSQYAAAQSTFETLTKQFGRNDAITLTSLGSAYRGRSAEFPQGAPDRDNYVRTAEASYKRALQASSNYGPAYYNLGLLYLDTDPYPGVTDAIQRLTAAKSYFDQYKNMPNFDLKLYESRAKDVDKAIKRAQKKAKKPKTS
ncbi:MAG: tetratricopeptide repeat protein [Kofleriaceae bacterium]